MDKFFAFFNFDDIGGKIKNLAKWSCWVTILLGWLGAIIAFFALFIEGNFLSAILLLVSAVAYSFLVWFSCWGLYAFGELVEDTHATRFSSKLSNIDKNLQLLVSPIARETEEKAKREAVESAKRSAEEKARREAEEKTRREAEERARREAEERARREAEEKATREAKAPVKREKTLPEHLEYALQFRTDTGLINYLKALDNEAVQTILKAPAHLVRASIQELLVQLRQGQ